MNYFAVLSLSYCFRTDLVCIKCATNNPCHLTCYISPYSPRKHRITAEKRGLPYIWYSYFCFVSYRPFEQLEAGDTLTHTFRISPWTKGQTLWFAIRGTIAGELAPSCSPLFEQRHPGMADFTFTIGSPPVNRVGQYGNVVGKIRYLINLANPSPVSSVLRHHSVFFSTVSPGKTGYLVTFYENAPGFFTSRDYALVNFPATVGPHTWHCPELAVQPGDFIGIGMPMAVGAPDYGIDSFGSGGAGIRHNQAGLTLPIVNEPFRFYPDNIMSLEAKG